MGFIGDTKQMTGVLALVMTAIFAGVTATTALGAKIDPSMVQTVVLLTTTTWGFYFGSSTGSKAKDQPTS